MSNWLSKFCFLISWVVLFFVSHPAKADDEEIPYSGTVNFVGSNSGFDYELEGVDLTSSEYFDTTGHHIRVGGNVSGHKVVISGNLNVNLSAWMLNEFKATVMASTHEIDANGEVFGSSDYVCDGSIWEWSKTFDGRKVKKGYDMQVPFNLDVDIHGYDPSVGSEELFIEIQLDIWQTVYAYESPQQIHNYVSLSGKFDIPVELKPEPKVMLDISNPDKLNPLKVIFTLTDTTSTPPKPIKDGVIRVVVPNRGSAVLGTPDPDTRTAGSVGVIKTSPQNRIGFLKSSWILADYFRCINGTQCLNGKQGAPIREFSTEYFYSLKNPQQPLEIVTNNDGKAELMFFLDFDALGPRVPRRTQPLQIPVRAEYTGTDIIGNPKLIQVKENLELKYLGYVAEVNYIKPQEFDNDANPMQFSGAELPLSEFNDDKGTPKPHKTVYGSDRVIFTPYIVALSPDSKSEIQRDPLPSRPLEVGTLVSYGDEIRIDARGLSNDMPGSGGYGRVPIKGKPGWIWLKIRFFDGLNAKVGLSGDHSTWVQDDRHTITFGHTPETSGWVPTAKSWWNLTVKEAQEQVISKFHPALGAYDLLSDADNFIKWSNGRNPIYIRVKSELHVKSNSDGSTVITVREGQPDVLTSTTPHDGLLVEPGSTMIVDSNGDISVRLSNDEEMARADELLKDVRNLDSEALEPIEVEIASAPIEIPVTIEAAPPPTIEETPRNWIEQFTGHYPLSSPSSSWLMAERSPTKGMSLSCRLNYTAPGTILDTLGLNNATAGNWAMSIYPDGRLCFQVYNVDNQNRGDWYRFTTEESLSVGEDYWVLVDYSDDEVLMLVTDEADNDMVVHGKLPCQLAPDPVYAGDFPGDDWWGDSYNIHPSAIGQLDVFYFGPRINESSLESFAGSYVIR